MVIINFFYNPRKYSGFRSKHNAFRPQNNFTHFKNVQFNSHLTSHSPNDSLRFSVHRLTTTSPFATIRSPVCLFVRSFTHSLAQSRFSRSRGMLDAFKRIPQVCETFFTFFQISACSICVFVV